MNPTERWSSDGLGQQRGDGRWIGSSSRSASRVQISNGSCQHQVEAVASNLGTAVAARRCHWIDMVGASSHDHESGHERGMAMWPKAWLGASHG
ncbi:hypothetical protein NL676_014334 [Syzygium grande]|nr:hypothetical protein NL676_014334 [Syzygium grande]